jgi:hypothetical protein
MAKKQERVPVTNRFGRGADAFFGPATEEEQHTGIPVHQEAGTPGLQQNSMQGTQRKTESHRASEQVNQQDSISGSQHTGKAEFMKATYYITPEQDMKLERLRLARKERGEKVDKSALIREAIDSLSG